MNATDRQVLASIPVPTAANGEQASACVIRLADGRWSLAWLVGTSKEAFGGTYPSAAAAAHASRYLNERAQQ